MLAWKMAKRTLCSGTGSKLRAATEQVSSVMDLVFKYYALFFICGTVIELYFIVRDIFFCILYLYIRYFGFLSTLVFALFE